MSLAAAQASASRDAALREDALLLPRYLPQGSVWESPLGTQSVHLGRLGPQAPQRQAAASFKASPLHQVRFGAAWLLTPLQAQETNAGLRLVPLPSKCHLFGPASVLHLAETGLCL